MAAELWMVTAGANVVMVTIYGLIAIEMVRAIVGGHQLRTNPLLTATAAIFIACTLGHGAHLVHATIAVAGHDHALDAARAQFADPRLLAWDAVTAVVAVYFYTLRSRFAVVYRGAALCEDMERRESQAMELHDNVVQGLVEAKLALDMGRRDEGRASIERTLASSRRVITDLLGDEADGNALGPGDLRRTRPVESR